LVSKERVKSVWEEKTEAGKSKAYPEGSMDTVREERDRDRGKGFATRVEERKINGEGVEGYLYLNRMRAMWMLVVVNLRVETRE